MLFRNKSSTVLLDWRRLPNNNFTPMDGGRTVDLSFGNVLGSMKWDCRFASPLAMVKKARNWYVVYALYVRRYDGPTRSDFEQGL